MKNLIIGCTIACLLLAWRASAATAPGFAATDFATGFANNAAVGPIGLAFDASGDLFVGNYFTGFLYKFGPAGGVASPITQVNTIPIGGLPAGLAFGKDGHLFLARQSAGDVVELDPATGTVMRTVASISFATGLATDPLSGDLFVSNVFSNTSVFRISNFASGPGTVTSYATIFGVDGLAFGPDGTLFGALYVGGGVAKIAGTNSPTPGAVTIINLPFAIDGMAVSADPETPFLFGNRNDGIITKVDLTTTPPTLTDIFTGGTRGDFAAVGFDGCLYATQTDRVVKVTNADGTCIPPPLGPLLPPPNASTLTLNKTVINDDGGTATAASFQAKIDGNDVAWGVAVNVVPGNHMVSEATLLTNYTASGWSGACAANGTVTIAPGQNMLCNLTNNDNPPTLRVVKALLPSGDTGRFDLRIDGSPPNSGAVNVGDGGSTGFVPVKGGVAHTVSEAGNSTNLADYVVTIGGACAAAGTITPVSGNSYTCTITNTKKNRPPVVTQARSSAATLWPPDHKMVPVSILGVTDPDGDPVSIRITGIMQDEATEGLGDGDTCPDGQGIDTSTAQLRAERSGAGNGRVYTIFFTAIDGRGGSTPGSVKVSVPHDQAHPAVDDGPPFDSTRCSVSR